MDTEPLFPYPRLLQMRVPSYELPQYPAQVEGVRLLQFGSRPVSVAAFQPTPPNTLLTIDSPHLQTHADSQCQADLPTDPVIAYLSKDTQAAEDVPQRTFVEVRDIHESDYKGPVSLT